MSSVTINEQTVEILRHVGESTELRDSDGKLLGMFTPATPTEKLVNMSGVRTTREVFERLRSHATDPADQADLDRHIAEIRRRDEDTCAAP